MYVYHLRQHPTMPQGYHVMIKDQLSRGVVEEIDEIDQPVPGATHYISHHAVIWQDKNTTKLYIVYNASTSQERLSLNDCLYAGPKFGQNILHIILRFQVHKVDLTADIEKVSLMVSVAEKDRNVLRFLWINYISREILRSFPFDSRVLFWGCHGAPFCWMLRFGAPSSMTFPTGQILWQESRIQSTSTMSSMVPIVKIKHTSCILSWNLFYSQVVLTSENLWPIQPLYREKSTNKHSYMQPHSLVTWTRIKVPTPSPLSPAVVWMMESKASLV